MWAGWSPSSVTTPPVDDFWKRSPRLWSDTHCASSNGQEYTPWVFARFGLDVGDGDEAEDAAEPKLAERSPEPNDARRAPDGSAGRLPFVGVVPGQARAKWRASATAGRGQGKPGDD